MLGLAWPVRAPAEEKARLVYVRGPGTDECPAEVDLRLLVMARLGYDPFSPQASRVVISRVEGRGDRLVSNLEVIDEAGMSTGQRELIAKPGRCGELARALALSISLAIDPERASQPSATTPPKPPERPAAAADPAPAPAPPEAEAPGTLALDPTRTGEPPPQVARGFAALTVVSSLGALPGLSFGATASLGLRLPGLAVSLDALGQIGLPRQLEPRGQLDGVLLGGGVSLCAVSGVWEACAVGRAAAQRLAASEVALPGASYGPFLGLGPRLVWALPLGRQVAITAGLEGLLHFTRNSAQLSGREVWRTSPVSGALQFGARTLFL